MTERIKELHDSLIMTAEGYDIQETCTALCLAIATVSFLNGLPLHGVLGVTMASIKGGWRELESGCLTTHEGPTTKQ